MKKPFNKQADAYLVEAEFSNGWKDTKISKLVYMPKWEDVDGINPEMCSHMEYGADINVWDYLNIPDGTGIVKQIYLDIVNQVAEDLKKQLGSIYNISVWTIFRIKISCPCIKVYQLMAGEKLPNGVTLVYFEGTWYTHDEAEKVIREYVEPYIREYVEPYIKKYLSE